MSFYYSHIWCAHSKERPPSSYLRKNKTYSTLHTWIIHITTSKLSSFTPQEKQTNNQMRAPGGEWWITLTASYIIFVRLPNIRGADTSVGTKFCLLWGKGKYFLWVKNLHSLDLLLHNDWSEHCFHKRRWTEAHLREFTCAYLSSPAGDSCSASVQTVSRDRGSWGYKGRWFNWQSCFSCNNNAIQFWAIALAKGNRIKLSVTTNISYHGRMMQHLLWQRILISLFTV